MKTPKWLRRFMREGRAANRVDHPNIVPVIDIDREGSQLFIVQELLVGIDLQQLLKRSDETLGFDEMLEIVEPVARALGSAHLVGLVHRDLKPANIFITAKGGTRIPKILDFGIAKIAEPDPEGNTPLTEMGSPLGTPGYMSPEQILTPRPRWTHAPTFGRLVFSFTASSAAICHFRAKARVACWWRSVPKNRSVSRRLRRARRLTSPTSSRSAFSASVPIAMPTQPKWRTHSQS